MVKQTHSSLQYPGARRLANRARAAVEGVSVTLALRTEINALIAQPP